jgi:hypothetical protein
MTIKEILEKCKNDPLYQGEFTEEGKKSLATITTGVQVTFIRTDNNREPGPTKDEKPNDNTKKYH